MSVFAGDFQAAAGAAQARDGEPAWMMMTAREQATAIYAELRKIDADHAKALAKIHRGDLRRIATMMGTRHDRPQ
ncbi:MAG TPA: hypothetical protein VND19_04200 [Acetobacteraceae bacterium]|nr:hypothetical protein [Acetobacteraceae bacterium]